MSGAEAKNALQEEYFMREFGAPYRAEIRRASPDTENKELGVFLLAMNSIPPLTIPAGKIPVRLFQSIRQFFQTENSSIL